MKKPETYKQIKSLDALKKLASKEGGVEVFIQLNIGRSFKKIDYNKDTDYWYIFNEIDDTEQELHTKDLAENTNIVEAINKGALFKWRY